MKQQQPVQPRRSNNRQMLVSRGTTPGSNSDLSPVSPKSVTNFQGKPPRVSISMFQKDSGRKQGTARDFNSPKIRQKQQQPLHGGYLQSELSSSTEGNIGLTQNYMRDSIQKEQLGGLGIVNSQIKQVMAPIQRRAITVQQQLRNEKDLDKRQSGMEIDEPLLKENIKPRQTTVGSCTPLISSSKEINAPNYSQQTSVGKLDLNLKLTQIYQNKEEMPQIRRVFLKTRAHRDLRLACSDSIVVPSTLFNILNDRHYEQLIRIQQGREETLFVTLADTRTFFNINMNILHRHHLIQGKQISPDISSKNQGSGNIRRHPQSIIANIHSIIETSQNVSNALTQKDKSDVIPTQTVSKLRDTHNQAQDDDTLFVPLWILRKLKIKEGDPLCLIFDLEYSRALQQGMRKSKAQCGLPKAEKVLLTFVGNEVIKSSEKRIVQGKHNRYSPGDPRFKARMESGEQLSPKEYVEIIRSGIANYKLLRQQDEVQVPMRGQLFHFSVKSLFPDYSDQEQMPYIIDNATCKIDIELANMDTFLKAHMLIIKTATSSAVAERLKNAYTKKTEEEEAAAVSSPGYQKAQNVLEGNDEDTLSQLRVLDLNEIVRTRGLLDLDLIEKVLEAKQREATLQKRRLALQQQAAIMRKQQQQNQANDRRYSAIVGLSVANRMFNMRMLDKKRFTATQKDGKDPMILVEDHQQNSTTNHLLTTHRSQSTGRFERVSERGDLETSRVALLQETKVQQMMSSDDSNFQRYTLDNKGEIKLHLSKQLKDTNSFGQSPLKGMSSLSPNTGISRMKDRNQELRIEVEDADDTMTNKINNNLDSNQDLFARDQDGSFQLLSPDNTLKNANRRYETEKTLSPQQQQQQLSIEFRNKRNGEVQRQGLKDQEQNAKRRVENTKQEKQQKIVIQHDRGNRDLQFSELGETAALESAYLQGGPYGETSHYSIGQNDFSNTGISSQRLAPRKVPSSNRLFKKQSGMPIEEASLVEDEQQQHMLMKALAAEDYMYYHGNQQNRTRSGRDKQNGLRISNPKFFKPPTTTIFGTALLAGLNIMKPSLPGYIQQTSTQSGSQLNKGCGTGPSYIEQRLRNHEILEKQKLNQMREMVQLKSQLDQMAQNRKAKGFQPPAPGQLSAMFNKYNDSIYEKKKSLNKTTFDSKSPSSKQLLIELKDQYFEDDIKDLLPKSCLALSETITQSQNKHRRLNSAKQAIAIVQAKPILIKDRKSGSPSLTSLSGYGGVGTDQTRQLKSGSNNYIDQFMYNDDIQSLMQQHNSGLRVMTPKGNHQNSLFYEKRFYHTKNGGYQRRAVTRQKKRPIKIPQQHHLASNQSLMKPWGGCKPTQSTGHLQSENGTQRSKNGVVVGINNMVTNDNSPKPVSRFEESERETKMITAKERSIEKKKQMNILMKQVQGSSSSIEATKCDPQAVQAHEIELTNDLHMSMLEHQRDCFKMHNVSIYENEHDGQTFEDEAHRNDVSKTFDESHAQASNNEASHSQANDDEPIRQDRVFFQIASSDAEAHKKETRVPCADSGVLKYWFHKQSPNIIEQKQGCSKNCSNHGSPKQSAKSKNNSVGDISHQQLYILDKDYTQALEDNQQNSFAQGKRQSPLPGSPHRIELALDNDYYKKALLKAQKKIVKHQNNIIHIRAQTSHAGTRFNSQQHQSGLAAGRLNSSLSIHPHHMMLYKREKGLKTLCMTRVGGKTLERNAANMNPATVSVVRKQARSQARTPAAFNHNSDIMTPSSQMLTADNNLQSPSNNLISPPQMQQRGFPRPTSAHHEMTNIQVGAGFTNANAMPNSNNNHNARRFFIKLTDINRTNTITDQTDNTYTHTHQNKQHPQPKFDQYHRYGTQGTELNMWSRGGDTSPSVINTAGNKDRLQSIIHYHEDSIQIE